MNSLFQRELESPTPKRQRLSPPTLEMLDHLHQHCVSPPIIVRRGNRAAFWHTPQERCHTPSHGRGNGPRRTPPNNPTRRSPPQLRRSIRQRERSGCDRELYKH
eukprot:snap_masked-scaffold181_size278858-processed-gene-1.22 protein:Tk08517 transcript:snap_masked-scaffold181_size278858-processed-gene-1.22-mRNA-1 annotation:"dna primase"